MPDTHQTTVLCLASDVKGQDFIRECHRLGCRVLLVTRQMHADGDWPREAIAESFYMDSLLRREELLNGVSWLARREVIDRIVALDDFDVEQAALLREHLRVPGMGDTTARHFRDKLAMRGRAREAGILVPDFVHAVNDAAVARFLDTVPAPWVLKPRSEGSAAGIRKLADADAIWRELESFGDRRSHHIRERFVPGDGYHGAALVSAGDVPFVVTRRYG